MSKTFRKYETRFGDARCREDVASGATSSVIVVSMSMSRRVRREGRFRGCHRLEALAVDDGGTALVVLLLGDPHLLEGGQRGQNGTTDPDGVLALGRSNDLDLHGRRSKSSDLLLHTVGKTRVHGGTTRLHGLAVAFVSHSENIP